MKTHLDPVPCATPGVYVRAREHWYHPHSHLEREKQRTRSKNPKVDNTREPGNGANAGRVYVNLNDCLGVYRHAYTNNTRTLLRLLPALLRSPPPAFLLFIFSKCVTAD